MNPMQEIKYKGIWLVGLSLILVTACKKTDAPVYQDPPSIATEKADVASHWADLTLYTIQFSRFNSPTYTSRSLGYLGLAMYESIVPGDSTHNSLSGQLNGLTLPKPDASKKYQWVLSMNAAVDTLLKLLYPVPDNSHRLIHERMDSLYGAVHAKYAADLDPAVEARSVQFGRDIALALYQWSVSDGGDKGFSRHFDPTFPFPSGPSYWVPPVRGQVVSLYPLHPHWGHNRTFLVSDSNIAIPPIEPYSTDTASRYYKMYREIYDHDPQLTLAERETAAWWGDDPTESASPPGHSFYLTGIAITQSNASLMKAAEAYARTGMAVADAFIHCWKVKYTYFNERPSSYAHNNFDVKFVQFWPEPPFPAFPSGHAIQSAAAATVQTDLFGDNFAFTDRIHEGHRRYDDLRFLDLTYPARHFNSFIEAALECGYSRLLGGIHTSQDNDAGRKDGLKIGEHVNNLRWTK
jgi:hypothetical protein